MNQAEALIDQLGLQPHPEGGWYREMWRGPGASDGRAVGTSILFLLEAEQSSHWHRVDAHEVWLWQKGDPIELTIAETDHSTPDRTLLGPDLEAGQVFQWVVPAGEWQAARPVTSAAGHGFSLVSCVVTPGFEFAGFELAPAEWHPGPHH